MKAFIFVISLCTLSFSTLAAPVKLGTNELIYQYCHIGNSEFEETVTLGQSMKVMHHQGAFMAVTSRKVPQAIDSFIEDKLTQVSGNANCAQFLLSRAVLEDKNLNNKVIARVLFDFDEGELNKQSRYLLLQLAARLEQDPDLSITGHTDSKGSHEYNFKLGLRRSQVVMNYLQANGIKASSWNVDSQGEGTPIKTNDTAVGRHENRRADIQS